MNDDNMSVQSLSDDESIFCEMETVDKAMRAALKVWEESSSHVSHDQFPFFVNLVGCFVSWCTAAMTCLREEKEVCDALLVAHLEEDGLYPGLGRLRRAIKREEIPNSEHFLEIRAIARDGDIDRLRKMIAIWEINH